MVSNLLAGASQHDIVAWTSVDAIDAWVKTHSTNWRRVNWQFKRGNVCTPTSLLRGASSARVLYESGKQDALSVDGGDDSPVVG